MLSALFIVSVWVTSCPLWFSILATCLCGLDILADVIKDHKDN